MRKNEIARRPKQVQLPLMYRGASVEMKRKGATAPAAEGGAKSQACAERLAPRGLLLARAMRPPVAIAVEVAPVTVAVRNAMKGMTAQLVQAIINTPT